MVDAQTIGSWAFLVGILLAILSGVISLALPAIAGFLPLVLVILGLAVGFLNIGDREIQAFLIAGIALLVVGIPNSVLLSKLDLIVPKLGTAMVIMLQTIALFAAPAVLVVSLKAFYMLSKTPAVAKGK